MSCHARAQRKCPYLVCGQGSRPCLGSRTPSPPKLLSLLPPPPPLHPRFLHRISRRPRVGIASPRWVFVDSRRREGGEEEAGDGAGRGEEGRRPLMGSDPSGEDTQLVCPSPHRLFSERRVRRGLPDSKETAMAANGVQHSGVAMFTDEELSEISGLKHGEDYIEVTCGCTSRRYGDAVGRLRVFASGELEIICDCTPGCQEDKLTPAAFEKHSGRETARRWKSNVWVIVKGEKVALSKTALLKYHNQVSKSANGSHKGHNGRPIHRDEFIRCTKCNKERRFRLRTKEECRIHHDALANQNWKCSDMPFDRVTCDDDEERASRKNYRGCTRSPLCNGCTTCVCFGCELCRFSDCSCQICVDFMRNA